MSDGNRVCTVPATAGNRVSAVSLSATLCVKIYSYLFQPWYIVPHGPDREIRSVSSSARPASGVGDAAHQHQQSRRQWDGEQQRRRPCFDGYKASSCSGGGGRVRSSGRVAASTGKQQQQRSPSCAGRIAEGQHGRNRKCKQAVMAAKAAVISAEVRWWAGAADKVTKQQQPGSSGSILYRGDYVFCGMSAAAGWAYRHQ